MDDVSEDVRNLVGELDFDQEELARRYAFERDVRLRPDRNSQYIATDKEFSHYADDPYVEPIERDPIASHNQVIVVGGGIAGILAAYYLDRVGITDVRVIEKGGDFGGTWYWNRYPGLRCDIESYVYIPLLEELGYVPVEKYSTGSEILSHLTNIATKLDLYSRALLQTQVTGIAWDEAGSTWTVATDRGDSLTANFVIMGNGFLAQPKLPGIPGIERFEGHTFHTSRWDYDYTGGSPQSSLTKLADKRVGIVGTGATSVQVVPELAKTAGKLFVFQRTPAAVDFRHNRPTDPGWSAGLDRGWQADRADNFHLLVAGSIDNPDLVSDGWTEIGRLQDPTASWAARKIGRPLNPAEGKFLSSAIDDLKMQQLRARIDEEVRDKQTAERLKPWHRRWCKRPLFSDHYLAAFNSPRVELVDTSGRGINEVTAHGVVVDGVEYELDCLIFATGYESSTAFVRRAGYNVIGRNGAELQDYWKNGIKTHQGIFIRDFPNLFMLGIGQSAVSAAASYMLTEQAQHIAFVLGHVVANGLTKAEPSANAVDEYVARIRPLSPSQRQFWIDCTPSYFTAEGESDNPHRILANLPPEGPVDFYRGLKSWRDEGSFEGMEFS